MEESDDKDQFYECRSEGDDEPQEKSRPPPPPPKQSTTTTPKQQAKLDSFFQKQSETTASHERVARDGDGVDSAPRPASKPKAPAANPEMRTAPASAPARVETSPLI